MNLAENVHPADSRTCKRRWLVISQVLGSSLLIVSGAQAAEWSLGPELEAGGRYDTNPRLVENGDNNDDKDDITGGYLDLAAVAARKTERSTFQIRPRLYFDRYDSSEEDSEDQFLDAFYRTRGQRSTFELQANAWNQQVWQADTSASTDQFAESELDDVDKSTSGKINQRRDRLRLRARPQFAYDISQRTKLGAAVEYVDVNYNNEVPGEASDYWNALGEIFVERALSQKNRLRLTGYASKYNSGEVSNDSKSYGGSISFGRDVSETFTWYAVAGAQYTEVEAGDNNAVDDNKTSYVFSTGVTRQWERTRLQAEASRSVDPSGSGFLKTRDGVRVNVRHQLRPRWAAELNVYAFQDDDLGENFDVNKRGYARALAKLSWQMSRVWFIEGGYTYTYQDYDDTPGHAESNAVSLSVVYRPFPKTWSR